jgi:tetratricopeptide (TPR) repeat protein
MRSRAARLVAVVALATLAVAGCGSPSKRASDYVARAQKFYDAGEFVKARLEAQNAAQVEPKNAKARYLLALIAENDGDIKQMFGHLLVAIDSDPKNVEAHLKLGTLYFLGQAWDKAEETVELLQRLAPDDPRVQLLNARVLIQKGKRTEALLEIDRALETDPDNVDGILLKAAAAAIENVDLGIEILDAAIARLQRSRVQAPRELPTEVVQEGRAIIDTAIARLEGDKTQQLRELRVMMLSQEERPEVEEGLQSLMMDFPNKREYQYQLARFYTSQGRIDEADALLKSLAGAEPVNIENRLIYVQFLATQRDAAKAEAALKTFIEQTPDASALRLALGQFYLLTRRPNEARAVYDELGRLDPKSAEGLAARNRVVALDIRSGRSNDALALVDKILKDAPDDPTALLLRAGGRFVKRKYEDAIADLRLVLRKEPDNERALLLLALAYLQTNDVSLAKDVYLRLLEAHPTSEEGTLQLAAMYVTERNYQEAAALLRRRTEAAPKDLLARGRLVEVLIALNKMAEAEAEARGMMAVKDQRGVGDFSLGRVLASRGDFAGAAEAYRASNAVRPEDPVPLEALAESLERAGRPQEAIAVLTTAISKDQHVLLCRFLIAGLYGRQGDVKKAEAYYGDVIRAKPEMVVGYVSLAGVYQDDRLARIRTLQRGLLAVPGDPSMSLLLGAEFDRGGEYDQAIAVYEQLLQANPDFLPGINNLVSLLIDHRHKDRKSMLRALELVKKLADSDDPLLLDTVGWTYYRNGDYLQAVGILQQVVARRGEYGVFRYHLAMAYLAAGNALGARKELTVALSQQGDFPNRKDAELELSKLQKRG